MKIYFFKGDERLFTLDASEETIGLTEAVYDVCEKLSKICGEKVLYNTWGGDGVSCMIKMSPKSDDCPVVYAPFFGDTLAKCFEAANDAYMATFPHCNGVVSTQATKFDKFCEKLKRFL